MIVLVAFTLIIITVHRKKVIRLKEPTIYFMINGANGTNLASYKAYERNAKMSWPRKYLAQIVAYNMNRILSTPHVTNCVLRVRTFLYQFVRNNLYHIIKLKRKDTKLKYQVINVSNDRYIISRFSYELRLL